MASEAPKGLRITTCNHAPPVRPSLKPSLKLSLNRGILREKTLKKAALLVLAASCLLLVAGLQASAADSKTLTGEYHWTNRDSKGPLEAIFTPKDEGVWDVSFHFEFRGEKHIYTGTAEGSLTEGALKGEVLNETKRRTFTFEGAFDGGQFTGTHAEIREGNQRETGTLTLG